METEKFDEAIRNKIGNAEVPFSKADVDRVMSHVKSSMPSASVSISKATMTFVAAAGSALIGGLLVWNVLLVSENEALRKQRKEAAAKSLTLEEPAAKAYEGMNEANRTTIPESKRRSLAVLEQENKKSSENPVECESTDLSSGIKKQHPALPPTRSKSEHVLTSSGTYQADANLQLHTDNDPVISTSKPDPFLVSYDGLMESKVMETVQGKEASEIPDDSEASRNSYPGEALRDNPMEDGGNVNLPVAGSYKTSGTETVSTSDRNDTIRENSQERMVAKDTASMKVK